MPASPKNSDNLPSAETQGETVHYTHYQDRGFCGAFLEPADRRSSTIRIELVTCPSCRAAIMRAWGISADPDLDRVNANQETMLRMYREAMTRILNASRKGDTDLVERTAKAIWGFHPEYDFEWPAPSAPATEAGDSERWKVEASPENLAYASERITKTLHFYVEVWAADRTKLAALTRERDALKAVVDGLRSHPCACEWLEAVLSASTEQREAK